jgi:hypothetical protein
MERQAYFEFVPNIQQTKLSNNTAKYQTQGDTLNQNSATVSHVNRDNFKLNAVYDVKIDTVNTLKITTKTNFTLLTVMSLLAVPLAAMYCCETNKSVCLLLIQIKQRFRPAFCFKHLLNPQNIIYKQ